MLRLICKRAVAAMPKRPWWCRFYPARSAHQTCRDPFLNVPTCGITNRLTGAIWPCVIARRKWGGVVDDSQCRLGPGRFVVERERRVRPGAAASVAAAVPEFPGHAGGATCLPARRREDVQR